MGERKKIKEYLTTDSMRTYYALDKSMLVAHRAEKHKEAEETARLLLGNADLPLLLRARACMVLGCGDSPDFLDMAKEGVRVAELGYSRCTDPGELEKNLVEDCKVVLGQAQQAFDEQGEDTEGGDDDGGELVWEAGEDTTNPTATTDLGGTQPREMELDVEADDKQEEGDEGRRSVARANEMDDSYGIVATATDYRPSGFVQMQTVGTARFLVKLLLDLRYVANRGIHQVHLSL